MPLYLMALENLMKASVFSWPVCFFGLVELFAHHCGLMHHAKNVQPHVENLIQLLKLLQDFFLQLLRINLRLLFNFPAGKNIYIFQYNFSDILIFFINKFYLFINYLLANN